MSGDEDFQHTSVDDILDGKAPAEPVLEGDVEQEAQPAATPAKGETEGATPATPEPTDGTKPEPGKPEVDVKGIIDERRKRQAAEQEIEALKKRLEGMGGGAPQRQTPQAQPSQRPDQYDDPEGARRWDQVQADDRAFTDRCLLSETIIVEMKGEAEYRAKESAFLEAVQSNPGLSAALRQSPNPALFAYREGAKHIALKEIGPDPAAYREKLKAEIRAEIEAEKGGQQPAPTAETPAKPLVPQTLAAVQSTAPRSSAGAFSGPTPLSKILGS